MGPPPPSPAPLVSVRRGVWRGASEGEPLSVPLFLFFFFLCAQMDLSVPPPQSPHPNLKPPEGRGLNVTLGHQSAQPPARVSWGGRVRGEDREEGWTHAKRGQRGEPRGGPPPIVHYDGHELLTDSGSSVSSRHAPLAALSRSCSHTKTLTERAPPPSPLQLWSWYVLQRGRRLQLQLALWAGGQTSSASHCSTRFDRKKGKSHHKRGTFKR